MSMKQMVRMLWAISLVVALPATPLLARAAGQISGRVTDSTGAVLPGTTVTVTQTETQLVRTGVTNELGVYTITNLPVFGNTVDRHDKQTVTRIDYQHNNSHSFFGRYMATVRIALSGQPSAIGKSFAE
jgi:hypothetical protein